MDFSHPLIITGGARRIGLELAKALHASGFSVLITYRTAYDSIEDLKSLGIRCLPVDFSDDSDTEAFIRQIQSDYSSVRGIIHNASSWQSEEAADTVADCFQAMIRIHAEIPYRLNLALADLLSAHMTTQGARSDIIHITDAVIERGSSKHIAYSASKAALDNLTLSFARKLAPDVKVNSLAPSLLAFHPEDGEAYRKKALDKSLLKTEGSKEEAVNAVRFLLSSQFITGRTLTLDAGRHLNVS